MPEAGEYLLSHVGFSQKEKPVLVLQKDGELVNFEPLGHTLGIEINTNNRHCVGWHDLPTGKSFPCPDSQDIEGKYEQCAACQTRTGFNPAFYNANSVSPQQEARNQEPHILYLAHFGTGTVKVGISHAKRGNGRLLEQGARSAIILETFPTAHIARQYEAKIAALPSIAETIQLRKKIQSLSATYADAAAKQELATTREMIEKTLGLRFANQEPLHLTNTFFPDDTPDLTAAHDATNDLKISGKCTGMLGSLLFCHYQDTPIFLPLKKFVGHKIALYHSEIPITLPARQATLFDF